MLKDGSPFVENATAEVAQTYRQQGWSVIPLQPKGKLPLLPWTRFQTYRATAVHIKAWWRTWPTANLGIVTGNVSGLVVVDLDGDEGLAALDKFPQTRTVQTARGKHLYFAHLGGPVASKVGVLPHVDLRGDAGLVVAPPSIHPTGASYTWESEAPIVPLPEWVLHLAPSGHTPNGHSGGQNGTTKQTDSHPSTLPPVLEGSREGHLWRLGRHLRAHGAGAKAIEGMLRAENADRCTPPLGEGEMKKIIQRAIDTPGIKV